MNIFGSNFSVGRGQLTFDAEGREEGRFFSRQISKPPGAASGVTLGRGYDMGLRTPKQVENELRAAGVSESHSRLFASGAGKRGAAAEKFVKENLHRLPLLGTHEQKRLFEKVLYPWYERDTRRLSEKPDVVRRYGAVQWGDLNPAIKDVLVDLRFRGDYTPRTRQKLQSLVVRNDIEGLLQVMQDRNFWINSMGVPADRFELRAGRLRSAIGTSIRKG